MKKTKTGGLGRGLGALGLGKNALTGKKEAPASGRAAASAGGGPPPPPRGAGRHGRGPPPPCRRGRRPNSA